MSLMRLNLWLILVALISACAPPPQQRSTKPTATQRLQALAAQGDPVLGKFAWLAGTWAGRDLGPLSLEVWEQPHGGVLLGHHQDVDGAFTPYFSYLRIEAHADGVALHVHPQGGEAVTYRIVETGPQMVVFANVNQSFPRRIVYGRSGDVLKVHQDEP